MRWVGYGFIHLSNFKTDVYIVLGPFCGEYHYCIYLYVWLKWEHCWSIFQASEPRPITNQMVCNKSTSLGLFCLYWKADVTKKTSYRPTAYRIVKQQSFEVRRRIKISLYLDCERCRVEKKHKARCKSSWE